ncbi:hypothetical protein, partial [Endozoicomonas acroporae]|uniref:hypothetical protein n=1 Tax=Endozoicomonas acroporae TaxID=1701104 RepID=UPI0011AF4E3A
MSITGTQTLSIPESDGPMSEGTGKSPAVNETGKSGDGSDVDSLSSPDDQGAETSSTSSARRASSAGTQTDADNSMPEETGNSPVVDEAKESGDGSDATSPASLVDQGTVTSPETLGASSTGSQTSSVTDSPGPMPEETGKSPVGDKAGKSGNGSDVSSSLNSSCTRERKPVQLPSRHAVSLHAVSPHRFLSRSSCFLKGLEQIRLRIKLRNQVMVLMLFPFHLQLTRELKP